VELSASGEEEFDGERTGGLPARPAFGWGEPLLRRLGVGICGETLAVPQRGQAQAIRVQALAVEK